MWKSDNVWKYFRQVSILVTKKNIFFEKNISKVLWELFFLLVQSQPFDFSKWSWESEILTFSFIFILLGFVQHRLDGFSFFLSTRNSSILLLVLKGGKTNVAEKIAEHWISWNSAVVANIERKFC